MELEFVISPQKIAFDRVYLCFSVDWNLQFDFFKFNDTVFRLDKLSVEVIFIHDPKQNMYSEVRQCPSKLYLIIASATMITVEGRDDELSEEGYFGHEKSSLTILLAIRALALDDGS